MKHYPEVIGIVVIVIIAALVLFGARWFNAATVTVSIHKPQPGITCAVVTSTDGAGIDCWEDGRK